MDRGLLRDVVSGGSFAALVILGWVLLDLFSPGTVTQSPVLESGPPLTASLTVEPNVGPVSMTAVPRTEVAAPAIGRPEDGELEELRATQPEEIAPATPPGDDLDRIAAEHNRANDMARGGFNRNGSEATTDERRLLWELAPDKTIDRLVITPRAFELMAKMIDNRHAVAQLTHMASDDFSPDTRAAIEAARSRILGDLLSWRGDLFREFNWQQPKE